MGVYTRGKKLWIRYRDAAGKWRDASTGLDVGQETLAQASHDEIVARIAAAKRIAKHAPARGLTVRTYAASWIVKRRERGLDWHGDEGRLRHHVLPMLGELPLADVRARHLVDLFHKLRTDKERPLAPKTIYNIYATVSAMFRDARLAELIEQSPCILDERQLGPRVDADPEWRKDAVFSREEAETLISDARIPFDRQMVYGLELLAGVRTGEGAALRWRHYDPAVKPLGKLVVARSYNSKAGREKNTKTEAVKHVPVHPTLAAMLAEWKLGGWAALVGRAPGPDDLIVPLPPDAAERRRSRAGLEPFRDSGYSGILWRGTDLPALGWRHRRHYDMRATFITLAIEDGADPEILENRVTHTRQSRSAFDGYNRGTQWERTCAEVAKLRIARGARREAVSAVIGSDSLRAAAVSASPEDPEGNFAKRQDPDPRSQRAGSRSPRSPRPGARARVRDLPLRGPEPGRVFASPRAGPNARGAWCGPCSEPRHPTAIGSARRNLAMLQLLTGNRSLLTMTGLTCLATAVACGPSGRAPELAGLSDQVAQVGTELTINLDGTDPDGDKLSYGFHAADLTDLGDHAAITQSPSGTGVFRWTPLGTDVGQHAFDFTASDGTHTTKVTINIDVRSAIGSATAPVFRQPLGTGTTLDLSKQQCIDLDIVIDDEDSAKVTITQDEPVIDGAQLRTRDGLTATWHWCPTHDQQAESRYTLVLGASDGDNPKVVKNYLVVLQSGTGTSCPGTAPVIAHTPKDVSSILDLTFDATITDDKGIKDAPLFYYAMTAPATPLDLSKLTQLTTTTVSGDRTNGVYRASVPNPVAQMPAGTKQTLYYVFVAKDDDDPTGSCDHTTVSQVYMMTVTSTATPSLPACGTCSSDSQCGAGNECVRMGSAGASYCLQACGTGCPTGYTCSTSPLSSVDGKMGLACVPQSGSCEMSTTSCADDTWEVNDTQSDASHNPVMAPDLYDLVSCPSTTSTTRANDDWFKIVVPSDQRVDLQLAGGPETDLDLHLYHSDGTLVTASTSFDANEEINVCLTAATYYVKVNGYGSARNPYLLSYDSHAESCNTTCVDDSHEDDDSFSQARPTFPGYSSTDNVICPDDDDWYSVPLFTGDQLTVDLTFTQSNDAQDLDLHLYKDSLDLTPCSAADPSTCSVEHGQGAVSNEHTTFTAPAGCELGCNYYVVVRGFDHSSNNYGISIGIQ